MDEIKHELADVCFRGYKLKRILKINGKNIHWLANRLGVHVQTVRVWVNRGRVPTIDNLVMIGFLLNIKIDDLLDVIINDIE